MTSEEPGLSQGHLPISTLPPPLRRSSDHAGAAQIFAGGGEMGRLMQSIDWSTTPLGVIDAWPQSLRIAVGIMLKSRYPMFVWWGEALTHLYNDAYRRMTLGAKHPWALSRSAREVWPEIWRDVGPRVASVLRSGQATWDEDLLLVLERSGFPEETYHTFSYSAVPDDHGNVGGIICAVTEDTNRVIGERRTRTLRELAAHTSEEAKSVEDTCRAAARILSGNQHDLPFVLIYLLDTDAKRARLAGATGLQHDAPAAPAYIDFDGADKTGGEWPLRKVLETRRAVVVTDLGQRFGRLPGGVWPESAHTAVVLPVMKSGQERLAGFLVAGASPRRPLDDSYRSFFDLVASYIATAVANARAYEEALAREAELRAQLADVLERMTDGFVALDKDWRITYMNAAAEKTNAITRESVLGRTHWEVFPGVLGTDVERELRRAMAERIPIRRESFYPPYRRWYEMDIQPVKDSGLAFYGRDITERKQIEEKLKRSEALLAEAQQLAHIGSWNWDIAANSVEWSDEQYRIFGLAPQETPMTYDRILRYVHPDDRAAIDQVAEKASHDRQPFELTFRIQRADGTVRILMSRGQIVVDGGKPVRMFGTTQDVTQRIEAEEARRRLRRERDEVLGRLQLQFKRMPVACIVADPSWRVIDWNPAAQKLFGYRRDEIVGVHCHVLVPPHVKLQFLDVERRLVAGDMTAHAINENLTKDGRIVLCEWHNTPLLNADGQMVAILAMAQDITERRRAEEALRESETSLAAELAGMARLQAISTRLVQAGDSTSLLQEIVEAAIAITSADMGNIQLLDRGSGTLKIVASRGFDRPFLEFFDAVHDGQGACGVAMARRERVVIEDVTVSPVFVGTPALDVLLAAGVRAVLSTPLFCRSGGLVGMLSTYYRIPHRPAERDLDVLDLLARQAADWIERTRAERALRDSEERIKQLLSLMPAAVYTCDSDGRITFYNRRAAQLWGREPRLGADDEKFCGSFRIWRADGSPLPHDQSPMAFAVRDGRSARDMEAVIEQPSGTRVIVNVNADPLYDPDGRRSGAINVFEDITQRKQAEEKLRQSESLLAQAEQVAHLGSWSWDLRSNTVTWSDEHYRLLGLQPQDGGMTYERACRLVHPDNLTSLKSRVNQALRDHEPFEHCWRALHQDGTVRYAHSRGRVELDDHGEPTRMFGTIQDITERKQAEQALRESEERFRIMADSSQIMIWVTDARGRIEFVNRAYLEFFGVNRENAAGFDWQTAVHPDDRERYAATFIAAIRESKSWCARARVRRHDGQWRWIESRGNPRFDAAGSVTGYIGSTPDITDMYESQQALKDADRRKDEFLATLAHELRNPLAPLRNSLNIQRLEGGMSPTAARMHEMMERQVTHMVRLVDDLLEVSRITRGTIELRKQPVEIAGAVKGAVETTKSLIESAGHELHVALPSEPLWLSADPVRLAQIFANLLHNAAKYTARGGNIWLTIGREENNVVVSVRDTGVGIPAEMLPRVFDMFTQVDNPLRRTQGGLGIGLTLVRSLVQLHGGSVEAHSEGIGKGTEMMVRLPLMAQDLAPSAAPRDYSFAPARGRRVLVVDDNRDAADSLSALLRSCGNDVDIAYDGLSALNLIAAHRPAIAFVDLGMPDVDGYDVARRVRGQPELREVRLIALTGWGQEDDRRRSHGAGFDEHLVKPVNLAALQSLLGAPKQ